MAFRLIAPDSSQALFGAPGIFRAPKSRITHVANLLQDRGSQQEWMIRQLVDVVEILEDSLLCRGLRPRKPRERLVPGP